MIPNKWYFSHAPLSIVCLTLPGSYPVAGRFGPALFGDLVEPVPGPPDNPPAPPPRSRPEPRRLTKFKFLFSIVAPPYPSSIPCVWRRQSAPNSACPVPSHFHHRILIRAYLPSSGIPSPVMSFFKKIAKEFDELRLGGDKKDEAPPPSHDGGGYRREESEDHYQGSQGYRNEGYGGSLNARVCLAHIIS